MNIIDTASDKLITVVKQQEQLAPWKIYALARVIHWSRYIAPITWALLSLYHLLSLPFIAALFAVLILDPLLAAVWPFVWLWFFLH